MATLGFHEDYTLRRATTHGLRRGDLVLPVTINPPATMVISAYNNLKIILERTGAKVLELLTLDPEDPPTAIETLVKTIHETAKENNTETIVIDTTGGSRFLCLTTILATQILAPKHNIHLYLQSDTGKDWEVKLDSQTIQNLTRKLTPEEKTILETIQENPNLTTKELYLIIQQKQNIKYKTLLNRISKLTREKLITRGPRGKIKLTPWTKITILKNKLQNNN